MRAPVTALTLFIASCAGTPPPPPRPPPLQPPPDWCAVLDPQLAQSNTRELRCLRLRGETDVGYMGTDENRSELGLSRCVPEEHREELLVHRGSTTERFEWTHTAEFRAGGGLNLSVEGVGLRIGATGRDRGRARVSVRLVDVNIGQLASDVFSEHASDRCRDYACGEGRDYTATVLSGRIRVEVELESDSEVGGELGLTVADEFGLNFEARNSENTNTRAVSESTNPVVFAASLHGTRDMMDRFQGCEARACLDVDVPVAGGGHAVEGFDLTENEVASVTYTGGRWTCHTAQVDWHGDPSVDCTPPANNRSFNEHPTCALVSVVGGHVRRLAPTAQVSGPGQLVLRSNQCANHLHSGSGSLRVRACRTVSYPRG